jgi:putative ABC transport system permease protein
MPLQWSDLLANLSKIFELAFFNHGRRHRYLLCPYYEPAEGDFFSSNDVRSASKVIVIGNTVATNLFPDESPIGKVVRLRKVPVKIIGVLKSKGQSMMGGDQDDVIIAPYTMVLSRLIGDHRPSVSIFVSRVQRSYTSTAERSDGLLPFQKQNGHYR